MPWVALVVSLGLLWGELGCLGWPWLSFLDPYGAHWVTRCRPGAPRAHQGASSFRGGVSVCKPLVFTARSAFLSLTYVAHFARVARFCGHGSPVETPLPHAPGVRMTVVELTPSNY